MEAKWDVSGDPCPVVRYEWAIQRADGLRVQEFTDMGGKTTDLQRRSLIYYTESKTPW